MYQQYQAQLDQLAQRGMLRELREVESQGAYIRLDGELLLNLSSNDYLGLAARGDLEAIMRTELGELGTAGSTSSRLMTGNHSAYTRLETALAEAFGREAALVFGSGYHMNVGILPALVDAQTVVLADRLVHASMIDGIRLSGVRFQRFGHNDLKHLERLLEKHREARRIIVMVESVYSMDGDLADLPALVELRRRYPNVMLYVDEAHGIGVLGERGLGLAEATGTIGEIDLLLGTFGKALASMGGYLICHNILKRYLVNHCRSLIFSTALPPICIAYAYQALCALPRYTEARTRLAQSALWLREQLRTHGLKTPSQSHIIPIIVGTAEDTIVLAEQLRALGYYAQPIRPPTVPLGSCRLRLSLSTEIDVEQLWRDLAPLLRPLVQARRQPN